MKKLLYFGILAAMLLGTSACNKDEFDVVPDGTEVNVSFVANLGDNIDSRTISDGTKADQLWFFVYENGQEITALRQLNVTVTNKTAYVTTKLVKGHTYSFVFWAQKSGNTFWGINPAASTVTMRPGSSSNPIKCNDDNADAFYNVLKDFEVTGSFTEDVTLYRPFAQINILASDAASVTDFENYTSSINGWTGDIKFPESMNLLTGETTGNTMGSILENSLPTEPLPGYEQYKFVCTRYVLAPVEQTIVSNINFSLKYNNSVRGLTIPNIPIRRNYRTNIIGDFFTEGANYNIVIDPIYYGELGQVSTWDGESVEDPVLNENGIYEVNTAAQLAGFAQMVANGNTFSGKTVLLNTDINLDDHLWTPIGPTSAKSFQGIFDGQGHTIFKLNVGYDRYGRGFFANIVGSKAVVKNINYNQANINGNGAGNIYGIVSGYAYGTVTFENIKVTNSTIYAFGKVGGILGMAADPGGVTTIKNCSVSNTTIHGTYNIGGLIGMVQNETVMENCSVENINWIIDLTADDCMIVTAADGLTVTKDGVTHALEGIWWKYGNWRYVVIGLYYNDYYYSTYAIDGGEEGIKLVDGLPHGNVDYQF